MKTVPADRLRPLLGCRVRLGDGVSLDAEKRVVWVPRRGRVERWWARRLHRGESRVRLRLDPRGLAVFSALERRARPTVHELAADPAIAVTLPAPHDPGPEWPADAVALLVFLASLARSGVLVTEPI